MLISCYLASAALFYLLIYKCAPVTQESRFTHAVQPGTCEVIELFHTPADQTAARAA